jgi:hypothetical protein
MIPHRDGNREKQDNPVRILAESGKGKKGEIESNEKDNG